MKIVGVVLGCRQKRGMRVEAGRIEDRGALKMIRKGIRDVLGRNKKESRREKRFQ